MIWKSFALLYVALCSAVATSPSAKTTSTSSLRGVDEKKTKSYRDNATDHNHHHQRSRILEEDVHGTYLLQVINYGDQVTTSDIPVPNIMLEDGTVYTIEDDVEEEGWDGGGQWTSNTPIIIPAGSVVNKNIGSINLKGMEPEKVGVESVKKGPSKKEKLEEAVHDKQEEIMDPLFERRLYYKAEAEDGEDHPHHHHHPRRRLMHTFGEKTVVAVRVMAKDDKGYSFSEDYLRQKVFGLDRNGTAGSNADRFNLRAGYGQCSYNQLDMNPRPDLQGDGGNITLGVITVYVDEDAVPGSNYRLVNMATEQINEMFGVSSPTQIADYFMFCLPKESMENMIAYAYYDNFRTVYKDEWCNYASAQLHELGHNFGFGHSGETADGSECQSRDCAYQDQTGNMGFSYAKDDSHVMCFNAAKSWQAGWYTNKTLTMNVGRNGTDTDCFNGAISGIADYGTTSNNVLIKIQNPDRNGIDLYVTFNSKKGINRETQEAGDLVTVVLQGQEAYAQSSLLAKMDVGSIYQTTEWSDKPLTIKVLQVVGNDFAVIDISYGEQCPTPACYGKITQVTIKTDNYPEETTWSIVNKCQDYELMSGGPYSSRGKTYVSEVCAPEGEYEFTIFDSYGDGLCCAYGRGSYEVKYGNDVVASGGEWKGPQEKTTFGSCPVPSAAPTLSLVPSLSPSDEPSVVPTVSSAPSTSTAPTSEPSSPPSTAPSLSPSDEPSVVPTVSAVPSTAPSRVPTDTPSSSPSSDPSHSPTNRPSTVPTSSPSGEPSVVPTVSAVPSAAPSRVPTDMPSSSPSSDPSHSPTNAPSSVPTSSPSDKPSIVPTASAVPSTAPSRVPTDMPSSSPSSDPSHSPTNGPSSVPTSPPSDEPSSQPSSKPSDQPTNVSSSQPSLEPTFSSEPSSEPSTTPSSQPSDEPSDVPTLSPFSEPSLSPSSQSSGIPSKVFSESPSHLSDLPSLEPSPTPTSEPSSLPTTVVVPSQPPTNYPTKTPHMVSHAPSESTSSPQATAVPSFSPTDSTTTPLPTAEPTPTQAALGDRVYA